MHISAALPVLALLTLTSATPGLGKVNGRVTRQGGICSPPQPTVTESGINPVSESASQSATTTASESSAPAPSESGTYNPILDVPYSGYIPADPESGGRRIRVRGRNDLCVTVQGAGNYAGSVVSIVGCSRNNETWSEEELWDIDENSNQIRLHANPGLCLLDAGELTNHSYEHIELEECDPQANQQQSFRVGSDHLVRVGADSQCLTVKKDPVTTVDQPHTTLKDLHTSPCDEDDPYQMFDLYDGPEVIGGQ